MGKRLTEPQQRLLAEIRNSSTGGLYVDRRTKCYRTALALERRGLITRPGPWHEYGWVWFEPVPPDQGPTTSLLAGRNESYFHDRILK